MKLVGEVLGKKKTFHQISLKSAMFSVILLTNRQRDKYISHNLLDNKKQRQRATKRVYSLTAHGSARTVMGCLGAPFLRTLMSPVSC